MATLSYIGGATGTTSVTLPAHQAGDLIVLFAYRDGSNTIPTIPAGQNWTTVHNAGGANTNSHVVVRKIAASSGETTGTFTNATRCVAMVYRGVRQSAPIGTHAPGSGSGSVIAHATISLTWTRGRSWVAGFAGHRSANTTAGSGAPTRMQNRVNGEDANADAGGYDTTAGVTSWTVTSWAVGGTSSGWRSHVLEIVEDYSDGSAGQAVGAFSQSAAGTALPYYEVSQVWLGVPESEATTVDASAAMSVGAFTLSANAEVYVSGTATQAVGAFSQSGAGTALPYYEVSQAWLATPQGPVSGEAAQTVGAFGLSATGEVYVAASLAGAVGAFTQDATAEGETTPEPEPQEPTRRTGGGAGRRVLVRIDDQEFLVSPAEAQRLIAQAEALAEQTAREKAAELARRDKVRYRAAKRAAPVIVIEAPEVAAIREQVADVNARIAAMYVDALRTALIAKLLRERMEQDNEDALAALLI